MPKLSTWPTVMPAMFDELLVSVLPMLPLSIGGTKKVMLNVTTNVLARVKCNGPFGSSKPAPYVSSGSGVRHRRTDG